MPSITPAAASELIRSLSSALNSVREVMEENDLEHTAAMLATYAWDGVWPRDKNDLLDALSELSTAVEASRGSFMRPDGTDLFSKEEAAGLLLLANAATARQSLIEDDGAITVESLAALAGVAEKTVRMATNTKSANPLQVTKHGHWTLIAAEDALAWLERRGDFKPTRMGATKPVLAMPADVAKALNQRMAQLGKDQKSVARTAGLDKAGTASLAQLLSKSSEDAIAELKPSNLKAVAIALDFDDPTAFAVKAYQLLTLAAANREIERDLCDS